MTETLCCGQPVGATGFCDVCGTRRLARPPAEPTSATSSWAGENVYSLPEIEAREPSLLTDPTYPERRQHCGSCGRPVGRRIGRQPPIVEGFCPHCATPFSFLPKLATGDLVADRYTVLGWLAIGGLGWLYLAQDRLLPDMRVVLKGVHNPTDELALRLARKERDTLSRLDHPNIVRIITYVEHPNPRSGRPDEFIVMEYVPGQSLQNLLDAGEKLRPEDVTAYGRYILAALDHLHGEGLLYCDMKPDNVMHTGGRVKVIDLGATRGVGDRDSAKVGTPGFQVDDKEIAERGLTVRSDVHTVGVTLRRLFEAARTREEDPDKVAFAVQSMELVLARATAPYEQRFASAAEMSEQLDGVHREILSLRDDKPRRMPATRFALTHHRLDTSLGTVPAVDRWTRTEKPDGTIEDGRPSAPVAAARLPVPRPAEFDPAAEFLATRSITAPRQLLREYEKAPAESVELDLARARAHIELGEPDDARRCIDRAVARLAEWSEHDWRIAWHEGLHALASDEVEGALAAFRQVYADVPGEVAPKLAIGFCLELQQKYAEARRHYEVVWSREEQASAAFGLARLCLRDGDRAEAVRHLDKVPRVSRHYDAARIAAVRVLLATLGDRRPEASDIDEAARRLPQLYLDGGEPDGEGRQRLLATLHEVALAHVLRTKTRTLFGEAVTENHLRERLEASFRVLADHAADDGQRHVLIDVANEWRPRTRR
jgi:serine/threonine-protein kinase PknG